MPSVSPEISVSTSNTLAKLLKILRKINIFTEYVHSTRQSNVFRLLCPSVHRAVGVESVPCAGYGEGGFLHPPLPDSVILPGKEDPSPISRLGLV